MRFRKLVLAGATAFAFLFFLSPPSYPASSDGTPHNYYPFYSPKERVEMLFDAILDCYPSVQIEKV